MTIPRDRAVPGAIASAGAVRGGGASAGPPSVSLEIPYRVRFDESAPAGTVRTSALLRYAQDCAWAHSERLGFGRDWYAARGLGWLVRAVELRLVGTLATGAIASVTTTVVGFRRVMARRRTTIVGSDGSPVASIDTDWAMIRDDGVPARIPAAFSALLGPDVPTFAPHRVALQSDAGGGVTRTSAGRPGLEGQGAVTLAFEVRPQELDPMSHANNAVYLDWLDEAVARVAPDLLETVPRTYRLEYLLPATPGRPLAGRAWPTGPASAAYRLTDPSAELLRGTITA